MIRDLYAHQQTIMTYARQRKHPLLFVEMRLGKTLPALRRCRELHAKLVLVVAPRSAVNSWLTECRDERIDCCDASFGTKTARIKNMEAHAAGASDLFVVVANKEIWRVIPTICNIEWDVVILDEAHFIKNPKTGIAKYFLKHFGGVQSRWALTGTPVAEGEQDAFTLLQWAGVRPCNCSTFWQFRQRYMAPDPRGFGWDMTPEGRELLRQAIGKNACVMRRKDVRMERTKVYERREVFLPRHAREAYDELEKTFACQINDVEFKTMFAGAQWQAMRQLADGWLVKSLVHDAKVDELIDLLLGELKDESVVVWCNYNAEVWHLEMLLMKKLIRCSAWTGETHPLVRMQRLLKFQRKESRVLILQQACAQTGMDLSVADTAIYFSTPAGYIARAQTEDRILSLKKTAPLLYIDLCTMDTVDEDLIRLINDKSVRSDRALNRALVVSIKERMSNART